MQAFDLALQVPAGVDVTAVANAELAAAGDCSLVWAGKDGGAKVSLACLTPIRAGGALLVVTTRGHAAGPDLSDCVLDEETVPCLRR